MSRNKPHMRLGMDRDVYQIVLKLEDEALELVATSGTNKKPARLTVSSVYDAIKRSNSSLARQKKKTLEDSIERVLEVRREQLNGDGDELDSDEEIEKREREEERKKEERERRDANLINRQIAKQWGFAAAAKVGGAGTSASESTTPAATFGTNGIEGSTGAASSGAAAAEKAEKAEKAVSGSERPVSGSERAPNGEPRPKKRKGISKEVDRTPPSGLSIRDIAGVDDALDSLIEDVWFPLCAGEACERMGYRYGSGVLLCGPSGCGKTTLAHAIAGSVGAAFIPISAPSIVGGTSGESEKNIRDVFDEAIRIAPCLIFLDELDAIAGKREGASKGMEGRMVAEIMNGMDRIKRDTSLGKNVVVLAATNRPDFLDPAIRRRFGTEIDMGMPSEKAREQILKSLVRGLNIDEGVNFKELSKLTPGYVGSDLEKVVSAAVSLSFRGSLNSLIDKANELRADEDFGDISKPQRKWILLEEHRRASWGESCIKMEQFREAISRVQPASKREGFSTIPDTTWANVGALGEVRKKLEMSIIGPIKDPELFSAVGIKPAAGILLWGPPGCGKTLVAKAVANESKANFISIKGPELLNKYVGESERAVRQLFSRAKSSAPCILFFDEMDALVPKRDDSLSDASARVVNTLLTELDGTGDRSGIYVIGATNRPDIIDEAIRRPGRLGTSIYVGLPTAEDRVDILKTLYKNTITKARAKKAEEDGDVDVDMDEEEITDEEADLAKVAMDVRCAGFSGADLGNLMQAAAQACLERSYTVKQAGGKVSKRPTIIMEDWQKALVEVRPSVKDVEKYAMME